MLKERLHWIDIMRGMAMLFVVMQHMSAYLYYDYLYYKFITIVDIGIFFFVSGYILDKVVCLNSFYEVLIFILKKTIQLMVPFFVWGVIAKHYFFAVSPSAITFEDLISQWTAPTLWFLLTLYGYMYYFADCFMEIRGAIFFLCRNKIYCFSFCNCNSLYVDNRV